MGGTVDIIDNCDPDKWSKIEIERICRDFGYTSISKLWYKMLGVDQELANFHLIVDDSDAMYLTELVRGHHDIHMYAEHPIHDPILVNKRQNAGEGVQDFTGYYDNDDGSEHDNHDGNDFYSFMIMMTCMLMRMSMRLMLMFLLRWLLLKWVQGE